MRISTKVLCYCEILAAHFVHFCLLYLSFIANANIFPPNFLCNTKKILRFLNNRLLSIISNAREAEDVRSRRLRISHSTLSVISLFLTSVPNVRNMNISTSIIFSPKCKHIVRFLQVNGTIFIFFSCPFSFPEKVVQLLLTIHNSNLSVTLLSNYYVISNTVRQD